MDRLTIPQLFVQRCRESAGDALAVPASEESTHASNGWDWISWIDLARCIHKRCCQLQSLGCVRDSFVVHIAGNGLDWLCTDLALQFLGAVHIPLSPLLTAQQYRQLLDHCQPQLVLCQAGALPEKSLVGLTEARPDLVTVMPSTGGGWAGRRVDSLDDQARPVAEGRTPAFSIAELDQLLADQRIDSDRLVSILYTSGTTGEPKGVMLTQRNIVSNVWSKLGVLPLTCDDIRLAVLPWTHVFGRVCDCYTWIASGSRLVIARGREQFSDDMRQIRPTYLNGVPYHYERLWREWKSNDCAESLAAHCGGRLRIGNCGGAAINDRVFDDYWGAGVALITGYGLTETSPVLTSSSPQSIRKGAVGTPVPGVEIRLAADGEVLARGENVMRGYYRNEAATRDVFDGEWFRTGDLGRIDEDGFLFLVGRKKEMIITNGGRNIAPTPIETALTQSDIIRQAMVIGDGQDFLTALIVLAESPSPTDETRLRQEIDSLLADFPRHERPVEFVVLDQPLSIEDGTLTAKGTLRRSQILERYGECIRRLYREAKTRL